MGSLTLASTAEVLSEHYLDPGFEPESPSAASCGDRVTIPLGHSVGFHQDYIIHLHPCEIGPRSSNHQVLIIPGLSFFKIFHRRKTTLYILVRVPNVQAKNTKLLCILSAITQKEKMYMIYREQRKWGW